MGDPKYPILVKAWDDKHPADVVACEDCHAEAVWEPADGDPYDQCAKCELCGGEIAFKYQQADSCPNCGKLGFPPDSVAPCCSRVCSLQWEYAQQLAAQRGEQHVHP